MTDIKTKEDRSKNMAAIHSKNTKPEVYLRKLLFSKGFRYRNNVKSIFGHPDIYLAKYNTAIFINGCFWHRHKDCKYAYMPKSRVEFWNNKFINNIKRDLLVKSELEKAGIKCMVVWECTIKKMIKSEEERIKTLDTIIQFLNCTDIYKEI